MCITNTKRFDKLLGINEFEFLQIRYRYLYVTIRYYKIIFTYL